MSYLKKEHFKKVLKENGIISSVRISRLSSTSILAEFKNGIAVIYQNTPVFIKYKDKIKIKNDGWKTDTTKKWINYAFEYLKINKAIIQRNFIWYLKNNTDKNEKNILKFIDGMTITV